MIHTIVLILKSGKIKKTHFFLKPIPEVPCLKMSKPLLDVYKEDCEI